MSKILPLKQDLPTDLTHEGKPLTYDSIHNEYKEATMTDDFFDALYNPKPPEPKPTKQPTSVHIRMARAIADDLIYPSHDGVMPVVDDDSMFLYNSLNDNKQWLDESIHGVLTALTALVGDPYTRAILLCVDPQMLKQAERALSDLYAPNQYLIEQDLQADNIENHVANRHIFEADDKTAPNGRYHTKDINGKLYMIPVKDDYETDEDFTERGGTLTD